MKNVIKAGDITRSEQRRQSRARDEARLESGELSADQLKHENSFFAAVPIKRFKIVAIGKNKLRRPI